MTPYHNFWHGFAVFQASYWALCECTELKVLELLDQFSLLIAALCHDMNHSGTNNSYHTEVGDDLAVTYNDASVLENMHARLCFETEKKDDCKIFSGLSRDQRKRARSDIIHMVGR